MDVLRRDETYITALVGPKDAGKTSLIACLFELVQRNSLTPLTFAGSVTFRAFERACHQARAASRRASPDTGRTSQRDGLGFFHLRLSPSTEIPKSLLIADRAGESYRPIIDHLDNAAPLVEVSRADVVSLLIDGERLADLHKRHQLRSEVTQILAALIESGLTNKRQRLALVLTKFDQIECSVDKPRVSRDVANLLDQLQRFARHFKSCRVFETAASPKQGEIGRGYGLTDLAAYWMGPMSVHAIDTVAHSILCDATGGQTDDCRIFWRLSPSPIMRYRGC